MTKIKYTIETIRELFEKHQYILMSTEYVIGKSLHYICPKSHEGQIKIYGFASGSRCQTCCTINNAAIHKTPLEEVKEEFLKHNCRLISNEYINSSGSLEYVCDLDHKNIRSFADFKSAIHKCIECGKRNKKKSIKYTIDDVRKLFADVGYTLLTDEYKNMGQKLEYKCDNGHTGSITLRKFLYMERRCKQCNGRTYATIDSIKKEFDDADCELISTQYISSEKLQYNCPVQHLCSAYLNTWRALAHKCDICGSKAAGDKQRVSFSDLCDAFKNMNYELLVTEEEYNKNTIKSTSLVKFKCNNNHINESTYRYIVKEKKCSIWD